MTIDLSFGIRVLPLGLEIGTPFRSASVGAQRRSAETRSGSSSPPQIRNVIVNRSTGPPNQTAPSGAPAGGLRAMVFFMESKPVYGWEMVCGVIVEMAQHEVLGHDPVTSPSPARNRRRPRRFAIAVAPSPDLRVLLKIGGHRLFHFSRGFQQPPARPLLQVGA